MSDGRYEVSSVPTHQDYLLAATSLLRDAGLETQTEVKPGGVAVHWRGLDPVRAEKLAREVPRLWKPLLDRAPAGNRRRPRHGAGSARRHAARGRRLIGSPRPHAVIGRSEE